VLGRFEQHLQETFDSIVTQAVVDVQSLPTVRHQVSLAQLAQLLRDIRLRTTEDALEVADAGLAPPQLVQHLQPDRVRQDLEDVRDPFVSIAHCYIPLT
jgi:diadenosine tetraphosphatase ApaH/serine/threonine PP2A family protein phosphatase